MNGDSASASWLSALRRGHFSLIWHPIEVNDPDALDTSIILDLIVSSLCTYISSIFLMCNRSTIRGQEYQNRPLPPKYGWDRWGWEYGHRRRAAPPRPCSRFPDRSIMSIYCTSYPHGTSPTPHFPSALDRASVPTLSLVTDCITVFTVTATRQWCVKVTLLILIQKWNWRDSAYRERIIVSVFCIDHSSPA